MSHFRAIFIFLLVCVACGANLRAQSLNDLRGQGQLGNAEQLRQLVEKEPPAGLGYKQLEEFFRAQDIAAGQLGDNGARARILRRWVKDVPNNFSPRWTLWRVLIGMGTNTEALELGETVVRDAPNARDKARAGSWLAYDYVYAGDWSRAQALLADAEKIIAANFYNERGGSDSAFYAYWAQMQFHLAQCILLNAKEQPDKAIEQCRLADESGRQMMGNAHLVIGFERRGAGNWHVNSVRSLAKAQLAAGKPFDSETTLRRAFALSKSYGLGRQQWLPFYMDGAFARIAQHDYVGAQSVAKEGLDVAASTQLPPTTAPVITLRTLLLQGLIGQGRWDESQALLAEIDMDVAGNVPAQRLASNPNPRAVVAVMTKRPQVVVPRLRSALQERERRYGPRHLVTGLVRGLLGVALAESAGADEGKRAEALQALTQAMETITVPSPLGEAYADAGLRPLYHRLILEKYLELATLQPPDDKVMAGTFRVADYLRGSSVQRALSEAAARSAAGSAGLADVVRREQDAVNETRALYAFIAEQSGREQDRRVDTIVGQMNQRIGELERIRVALKADIARQFPDYDRLVNPQPPSPADIAQRLAEGEVFISMLPTRSAVYVWAVGKSGTAFHRASLDEPALRALVQRIRKTLDVAGDGASMPRFDAQASAALFDALLKPIEGQIRGARHLIFAPGGVLGQVPMGVLLSGPPQQGSVGPVPWLIRQAAVSHVASARMSFYFHINRVIIMNSIYQGFRYGQNCTWGRSCR